MTHRLGERAHFGYSSRIYAHPHFLPLAASRIEGAKPQAAVVVRRSRVKFFRAALIALVPAALFAAEPALDIKQPQFPLKPAPDWLKIVDQGKFDPRLKGYFAPEGFKVEIV